MTRFFPRMAVLALVLGVLSTQARALTLADLTNADGTSNGQTVVVGDKTFSNFTYQPTGDMPPRSGVTVTGVSNAQGIGLEFTGAFTDIPPPSSDALLAYTVTVNTPGVFITDWHLTGNPSITPPPPTGQANVSVTDTFFALNGSALNFAGPVRVPQNSLSIFATNPPATSQTTDSGVFVATNITALRVQKDILISSTVGQGSLSFVDQIASQSAVPEPTTMVMAAFAFPLLLTVARRRSKALGRTVA